MKKDPIQNIIDHWQYMAKSDKVTNDMNLWFMQFVRDLKEIQSVYATEREKAESSNKET